MASVDQKYSRATWDSCWRITVRTTTGMLALAVVLLVGVVTQPKSAEVTCCRGWS